jgi:hypothetical protein
MAGSAAEPRADVADLALAHPHVKGGSAADLCPVLRFAARSGSPLSSSRWNLITTPRPAHSGPALRALLRAAWRRGCRAPGRSRGCRRAWLGHPSADMAGLIASAAEPPGPARGRWRADAVRGRRWPERRGGGRGGHLTWRWRRDHSAGERSADVGVGVGLGRSRRHGTHPDNRGQRQDQEEDHERQGGFEHLIQHRQTQVSHSSLLSRPVAGSCPDLPSIGQTEHWLWIDLSRRSQAFSLSAAVRVARRLM